MKKLSYSKLSLDFYRGDNHSRGSCNFCNDFSQSNVYEVGGNGVVVRLCIPCMDTMIKKRETINKTLEIKRLLIIK